MIVCKCGQEFKNYDEWRTHYNSLKIKYPYPNQFQVDRGLITPAKFLSNKKAYEKFVEDHAQQIGESP